MLYKERNAGLRENSMTFNIPALADTLLSRLILPQCGVNPLQVMTFKSAISIAGLAANLMLLKHQQYPFHCKIAGHVRGRAEVNYAKGSKTKIYVEYICTTAQMFGLTFLQGKYISFLLRTIKNCGFHKNIKQLNCFLY